MTGTHESIFGFTDLVGVTPCADDVQNYYTRWDEVLSSIRERPQDNVMESLHKMRRRVSEQLKMVLEVNDQDIEQNDVLPSNQRLKTKAEKFSDQRIRNRSFEVTNNEIPTGTPPKSRSKVEP